MILMAYRRHRRDQRGATLVVIALLCVFLVCALAFAFEVGRMYLLRSQVQRAVDAGAVAGSLALKQNPTAVNAASAAARDYVQENRVGWLVTIPEDLIDVEVGVWDVDAQEFREATEDEQPTSVRVVARQDREPFFFARVVGQETFGAQASAIAAGGGGPLDIMLVLDLSQSMEDDGRIQALRNAAPTFVDVINDIKGDDRVGVMFYGAKLDDLPDDMTGTPYTAFPADEYPNGDDWVGVLETDLTDAFSYINDSILPVSSLQPGRYGRYTPIGGAIRDATHYLKNNGHARDGVRKAIVLMSDGEANRPENNGPGYAREMASYANDNDVKVYTISLGDGADVDLMEEIAAATGAKHFDATGSGEDELTENLKTAFERAARALKRTVLVQ